VRRHGGPFVVGLAAVLAASPVWADRGALSFDFGAGLTSLCLPPPFARSGDRAWTLALSTSLGLRYAVTNQLELSVAGFDELPTEANHPGVLVATADSGSFSGTLHYQLSRFGVVAGARYVTGLVVRLVFGLEAGWSHRAYSAIQLLDATRLGAPDLGLGLQDFGTDSLVLQPLAGLEWAFSDHWSTLLIARFTVLVGPEPAFGVSLSFSISYGWFP
jgi:hypothetical protein